MSEQLQLDFDKIIKTSKFSNEEIQSKKFFLKKFIENGFPNRKQEDWKFLDISQIIKKDISDLSFFNDYSQSNKIDPSIFVDGLEHNKIIFINGRIEKIAFNFEDQNEILQMSILNPKLSILDETDSGLDIDALKTVADGVNGLRKKNNSFLIITHYQRLLEYIKPDFVHVLMNGKIIKSGGPELALELEKKGYENIN